MTRADSAGGQLPNFRGGSGLKAYIRRKYAASGDGEADGAALRRAPGQRP